MRAVVLSGGEGSRLRPITHTQAKQLIPVGGTPILFHALATIRDAGIDEVAVVVGPPNEDEVRDAVGDGGRWGIRITFVRQAEPLGLAHAVLAAADFVRGEPFLLYLGDNVILEGVTGFVREFERTRPDAQIFVARVPEPERFGVVQLDGDQVVRLVEKPKEYVSDLALVGVYLFDDSILEACSSLEPSWRGEYEITEAIQWLVDRGGTVRVERLDGWWKDTGKPDDLLEANRMLLSLATPAMAGEVDAATSVDGVAVVGPGAKITRSRLQGPVVIGANTIVEDSTVGPDVSLEPGCRIVGSTIRDSILMEGCRVVGVDALTGSLLGRNVDVEMRASSAPRRHRLVLGDQSRLEVD
jgi:glucose-1-phosphate thymidylyltransferase